MDAKQPHEMHCFAMCSGKIMSLRIMLKGALQRFLFLDYKQQFGFRLNDLVEVICVGFVYYSKLRCLDFYCEK